MPDVRQPPACPRLSAPSGHAKNVAALDVALTPGEMAALDPLGGQVVGARY
jgi:hypothetical protein